MDFLNEGGKLLTGLFGLGVVLFLVLNAGNVGTLFNGIGSAGVGIVTGVAHA